MREVQVDFANKEVTVTADPARFQADDLIQALAKAGFEKSTVKIP